MDHKSNDNESPEGRRGFLKCMAMAGTGTLWLMKGGVLQAHGLADGDAGITASDATFSFVQVSDSHIGFHKEPNMDVAGSFRHCLARATSQRNRPDFILHTGDLTHLSRAEEFDTVAQLVRDSGAPHTLYVPGEHDVIGDNGAEFFKRFGEKQANGGWYSFDHRGVHFVGLINVLNLKAGGLGFLGPDQLAWLKKDLAPLPASTPLVVFAHMPLWNLYESWGWGTDDSAQAMTYLKRFGSVTVLNGHVHQVQQKVEGTVTFHTARSTAYPQPSPGVGPGPGPLKDIVAGSLKHYLGVREVHHVRGAQALAVAEEVLA